MPPLINSPFENYFLNYNQLFDSYFNKHYNLDLWYFHHLILIMFCKIFIIDVRIRFIGKVGLFSGFFGVFCRIRRELVSWIRGGKRRILLVRRIGVMGLRKGGITEIRMIYFMCFDSRYDHHRGSYDLQPKHNFSDTQYNQHNP